MTDGQHTVATSVQPDKCSHNNNISGHTAWYISFATLHIITMYISFYISFIPDG